MQQVKWGEYKIKDLFSISNTLSFNSNVLVDGNEYDYITRTSFNQGILKTTGFVNEENVNSAGNWSLGLLQMDFFYRRKPWYAGQFVRKVIPKFKLSNSAILFFTTLLNRLKPTLLSVLVRDVDKTFLNSTIQLPITANGEIDFGFIAEFVAELEAQRVAELETYLQVTGLKDYNLTDEEQTLVNGYDSIEFCDFKITDVFNIKNSGNILSRDIVENSGTTPYLCASAENNAISSYISYSDTLLDKGNCIFIGGKTFVVTYQEKDFYSNDSHNLILRLMDETQRTKANHLCLATCINKSLKHKYSWGDSISSTKIKKDIVRLPSKNKKVDFDILKTLISAASKLVIKDVVLYADKKIAATKEIIKQQ
ncbi:MAG: restriction endonuclease subunit S [Paludibacteraceae bacterium]|nr:restriction endonuclease subunit S [Paludibacteraceae bacterium]